MSTQMHRRAKKHDITCRRDFHSLTPNMKLLPSVSALLGFVALFITVPVTSPLHRLYL
jgi:hypothetical protein